jgi:hypothetical protein
MGNSPYMCHLEKIGMIREKMTLVARPKQKIQKGKDRNQDKMYSKGSEKG